MPDKPIEFELTDELRAKLTEEVTASLRTKVKADLKESMTEVESKIDEKVSSLQFTDDQKADFRAKLLDEAKDAIRLEMKEHQPKQDETDFNFAMDWESYDTTVGKETRKAYELSMDYFAMENAAKRMDAQRFMMADESGNVTGIPGAATGTMAPYYELKQYNPLRDKVTIIGVMGDTYLIPKITVGNHSSNAALHPLGATGNESDIAETSHVLEEWSLEVVMSKVAEEDLPGYMEIHRQAMTQSYARSQGADIVAKLKAGSGIEVKTGVAAALPTVANVLGRVDAMELDLDPVYHDMVMSCYFVNPKLFARIREGIRAAGGGAYNIATERHVVHNGYQVMQTSLIDNGGTANHVSGYFGMFGRACYLGEKRNHMITMLPISRGYEVSSSGRFEAAIGDNTAYSRLVTKA